MNRLVVFGIIATFAVGCTVVVPPVNPCETLVCDDGNPCTDDSCVAGECVSENNTDPCDDGDPCTEIDTCSDGTCVGAAMDCDDGDECTLDDCDGGDCVHEDDIECLCSDVSITEGIRIMCPSQNTTQLEGRSSTLTGLCENGDSRADAFSGVGGFCVSQSTPSGAVGCGLCEGTFLNRIWTTSDSDLQVMCPALSDAEVLGRIDTLEMLFGSGSSREDIYTAAVATCRNQGDVEASVGCALCETTLIDRIWSD